MSKFVTGKELNDEIYHIIWDAKKELVLVSPFIRLDKYFRGLLEKHNQNENLHILLVFGKNEGAVSKSLNSDDFEFFKQFPNISIVYQANLHAKYYGNETKGMITSINLHDHSFENNIEFGVLSSNDSLLSNTKIDKEAWGKCLEIAYTGTPVFIKRPKIQKKVLGIIKSYIGSEVLLDMTTQFYSGSSKGIIQSDKKLEDFPDEIEFVPTKGSMPEREMPLKEAAQSKTSQSANWNEIKTGYCIRTGVKIPFSPEKPFCYDAFKEWAIYENWEYSEKYCHLTGEKSYGKTSRLKPILNDEYKNKVTTSSFSRIR
jgi:hypothetical protein